MAKRLLQSWTSARTGPNDFKDRALLWLITVCTILPGPSPVSAGWIRLTLTMLLAFSPSVKFPSVSLLDLINSLGKRMEIKNHDNLWCAAGFKTNAFEHSPLGKPSKGIFLQNLGIGPNRLDQPAPPPPLPRLGHPHQKKLCLFLHFKHFMKIFILCWDSGM